MPTRKERKIYQHEEYVQIAMDGYELFRCRECGRLYVLPRNYPRERGRSFSTWERNYQERAEYGLRHHKRVGVKPVWAGFVSIRDWCYGHITSVIEQLPDLSYKKIEAIQEALKRNRYERYSDG